MDYPGRVIKAGETDRRIVQALKNQLNKALVLAGEHALQLDADNPNFGPQMKRAVRLFQARQVDQEGRPLKTDGEVGAITWGRLFGIDSVPAASQVVDPFLASVLKVALAEEARGVREQPVNSNDGPDVRAYLASVGLGPGFAWCCAFTYWCFDQAAKAQQPPRGNPMVRTGGCLKHWNEAAGRGARRIARADAVNNPALVQPGMVFIMDFGGGAGHTGFVVDIQGGLLHTVEGNTDASKTREGGGVYRLTRKLVDINKGFIDYAGV